MTDIPFVDAHVHFWDLDHLRYDWLTPPFDASGPNGDVSPIARTYLPADYQAETAAWRVLGAVHVDAGACADQAWDETVWLERLGDETGLPTAIVAYADLADPAVDEALARQAESPRVRGIRQIVNWHADPQRTYTPDDMTLSPAWQRGFARLAAHGLSFDLQCYPGPMAALAPVLARHGDVPVFLNHMGMPVVSDADGLAQWRAGLRALAALPHVAIKLSGMGFVRRDWTPDLVRPLILEAIDLFGPDRAMFASDLPTDRLFGTVDAHLSAYHAIVADFGLSQRRALFGGNANRLYRLDLDLETL
ncbi:amidohydrolase family protein [Sphingomonas sp. RP10(2022)]|uniref:Amidohydrolase family protein n=1 Tax=Sphingomonas liriopis TaxID=2949094 RepID=A0A9X2HSU1_9SPHN|nr:amidohydrolase family protein [Sphingomonas liriopis]MCP3735917.1 amidohydrolase family protein [Sphingomonas liriopis]